MTYKLILTLVLLGCVVSFTQVGTAATADFFAVPSYPVTAANSIAIGDFNNDGITDVAIAGASTVSVLLGNKNGTFQAAVNYTLTASAVAIGAGDFNNDGRPDIAVLTGTGSVGMNLLLGNGDGTFQTAHSVFFQGLRRLAFVLGDFNKDGDLDVAVANNVGHNISVLLGTGTGSFQAEVNYSTGSTRNDAPSSLSLGDVNGDGKLDLVAGVAGSGKTFLGNGDGTFQSPIAFTSGGLNLSLADLNLDGKLDLVETNGFVNALFVQLGNGDGTFQSATSYTVDGQSSSTQAAVVLDLSGDGKPDVAIASPLGEVSVLLGNGDGTLQAPVVYGVGLGPVGLLSAKFGVGQKLGLAVADGGQLVSLAIINRDGSLQAPRVTPVPAPQSAAIGDINSDGKMDAIIGNGGDVDVLNGNGDSTFQSPTVYSLGVEIGPIAVGDLNGDGKPDVVVASTSATGSVLVLLNNGDGTLGSPVTYSAGRDAVGIALGDFNGDHKLDIAVTSLKDNTISILLNNGDGSFQSAVPTGTAFDSFAVTLADFNGDGKLDAAVQGSTSITDLLGKGDGTFSTVKNYNAGQFLKDVRAADFTGDGKPDLVASDYNSNALDVLLNKGDGTFGAAVPVPLGVTPTKLEVGDFNGDGKQDVAVAGRTVILNGNGNGTFQAPSTLNSCGGSFVFAANFNADGRPDLLNVCSLQFMVLPNAAGPH